MRLKCLPGYCAKDRRREGTKNSSREDRVSQGLPGNTKEPFSELLPGAETEIEEEGRRSLGRPEEELSGPLQLASSRTGQPESAFT